VIDWPERLVVAEPRPQQRPPPGSDSNSHLEGGNIRNQKTIAGEAADLIFHLRVALAHYVVKWRLVQEVLAGA
jgi:phosphoribosyl-ATP pyrophosphohydrolase/phosphoribosyl-AMP cyclohydrolase